MLKRSPYLFFGSLLGGLLVLALLFGTLFLNLNPIGVYFLAINVITFCTFGYDKKIASSAGVRVPERLLHLLSLFGGSPSAFMAQRLFRHKTAKSSFQLTFWIIVVIQITLILLVVWWVNM